MKTVKTLHFDFLSLVYLFLYHLVMYVIGRMCDGSFVRIGM